MMFALREHHKWSLPEVEALMPWERDIYVHMINALEKEKQEQMRDEARQRQ